MKKSELRGIILEVITELKQSGKIAFKTEKTDKLKKASTEKPNTVDQKKTKSVPAASKKSEPVKKMPEEAPKMKKAIESEKNTDIKSDQKKVTSTIPAKAKEEKARPCTKSKITEETDPILRAVTEKLETYRTNKKYQPSSQIRSTIEINGSVEPIDFDFMDATAGVVEEYLESAFIDVAPNGVDPLVYQKIEDIKMAELDGTLTPEQEKLELVVDPIAKKIKLK